MVSSGDVVNIEQAVCWRVGVCLVGFVVLSNAMIHGLGLLEKRLRTGGPTTRGLAGLFKHLREELLSVGIISLFLVVSQPFLVDICVSDDNRRTGVFCPADHEVEAEDPHRLLLGSVGQCGDGKRSFVDATTLHQAHILVFVVAVLHVVSACFVMVVAQVFVKSWRSWEVEHVEGPFPRRIPFTSKLWPCWRWAPCCCCRRRSPLDNVKVTREPVGCCQDSLLSFVGQFTTISPARFLALRNLFLLKHGMGHTFQFWALILKCTQRDFAHMLGIRWMWLLVAGQVLLDGYLKEHGRFILIYVNVVFAFVVGAKLHHISWVLTHQNIEKHKPRQKVLTATEVRQLQLVEHRDAPAHHRQEAKEAAERAARDGLFWFGRPLLMLSSLRLVIFLASQELAFTLFYLWQRGTGVCYFDGGAGIHVMVRAGIAVLLLVHTAIFSLPTFVLVEQMGDRHRLFVVHECLHQRITDARPLSATASEGSPNRHPPTVATRKRMWPCCAGFTATVIPTDDQAGFVGADEVADEEEGGAGGHQAAGFKYTQEDIEDMSFIKEMYVPELQAIHTDQAAMARFVDAGVQEEEEDNGGYTWDEARWGWVYLDGSFYPVPREDSPPEEQPGAGPCLEEAASEPPGLPAVKPSHGDRLTPLPFAPRCVVTPLVETPPAPTGAQGDVEAKAADKGTSPPAPHRLKKRRNLGLRLAIRQSTENLLRTQSAVLFAAALSGVPTPLPQTPGMFFGMPSSTRRPPPSHRPPNFASPVEECPGSAD